ncbi:MAG: sodium:solute symporter [Thermoplasmata archaeon]
MFHEAVRWPFVIGFIIYFVVIWVIAHRVATRVKSYLQLAVGGRVVSYLAFAFLISGTYISAVSVFGGVGTTYEHGYVSVVGWALAWMVALILALFIGYRLRRPAAPPFTLPEAMKTRFELGKRRSPLQFIAAFWGLIFVGLFNMLQIKGFGLAMESITGFPFTLAVALYAFIVIYIGLGGYLAIIRTNIVHQFVILAGLWITVLVILAMPEIGGLVGLHTKAAAVQGAIHPDSPYTISQGALLTLVGAFPIIFLLNVMIANMLAWSAPFWPSVLLGSKSVREMLKGGALASLFVAMAWVAIPLIGLSARVFFPVLPAEVGRYDPDVAFPLIIGNILPESVGIIALLGLFAAAISTSTVLLLYASLFLVNDMIGAVKPEMTKETMFKLSRVFMVVIGLITLGIAIAFPPTSLLIGAQLAFAISAAALAVPIGLGLYWKRMTRAAAYTCLIIPPIVFMFALVQLLQKGEEYPLFLPPIALALVVAIILAVVVSLLTKPAPEESTRPFWEWK